jgi:hypothetical protein
MPPKEKEQSIEDMVSDNFDADPRRYIDETGTHYLKLVQYDFFDGSYDEKTKRGYSGKVGPLFIFEVAESEDGALPKGENVSRMLVFNATGKTPEKTKAVKRAKIQECKGILCALIHSASGGEDAADELDAPTMSALIQDVDQMGEFIGHTVRCDAKANGEYVNCKWSPDDRGE